jgi:hypothetical protein
MSEESVELARKAGELYRGRAEVREWIEQLFELAEAASTPSGLGTKPSKPPGCE